MKNEWVIYGGEDSFQIIQLYFGAYLFSNLLLQVIALFDANEVFSESLYYMTSYFSLLGECQVVVLI